MANSTDRKAVAQIVQGFKVSRSTATLPQTGASALFNILGGRVMILGIVGQVTTAIQNQANNTKLVANPDTGTSVDICAVLSTANKEVGTLLGITGTFATALVGANAGATVLCATPVVVNAGTIDLDCSASNTGSVKWDLWYLPLDDGAYVTAA
jgi:hypothetical protein